MAKKQKYKMTFEVVENIDDLIDEETFAKVYKRNLLKLCRYMFKEEGLWWSNELKLTKAEFID